MKIVLATGIYPPDIGGPATYVRALSHELSLRGHTVLVVTYGTKPDDFHESMTEGDQQTLWRVIRVPVQGGSLLRWRRYAKVLKKEAADADIVEVFSSVSTGMPVRMARLKRPKKILRLGGDFLWERYTDIGGRRSLRNFYATYPGVKSLLKSLLHGYDHIVFSTFFQQTLCEKLFGKRMPSHSVIENALPHAEALLHEKHEPLRLLSLGRLVRFKNLPALLNAVVSLPHVRLSLIGEGPIEPKAKALVQRLGIQHRVNFLPPVHGEEKDRVMAEHDVLVLPSLTEISPNVALEARAKGLPVLLTEENGLSDFLREGMVIRPLRQSTEIVRAVLEIDHEYAKFAAAASAPFTAKRSWIELCDDQVRLFESLL